MSSGRFINSFYVASYLEGGSVRHPIKIQPETTGLTIAGEINTPAQGPADIKISARATGSRRTIGLVARRVTFKFVSDNPQDGRYKADSTLTLPWLNPFPASFTKGATGTYLGEAITLVGTIPEYAS